MNSCNTCALAVRPAKDLVAREWLEARGLAYCKPLQKPDRKFLITLINAAGPMCGGRFYEAKTLDLFEAVDPLPAVEAPKQGAFALA